MSDTDVIYRHLTVKACNDDIVPIQIKLTEAIATRLGRMMCKTIDHVDAEVRVKAKMEFEAHLLRPKFIKMVEEYEVKLGKRFRSFTKDDWDLVENKFMKKYLGGSN